MWATIRSFGWNEPRLKLMSTLTASFCGDEHSLQKRLPPMGPHERALAVVAGDRRLEIAHRHRVLVGHDWRNFESRYGFAGDGFPGLSESGGGRDEMEVGEMGGELADGLGGGFAARAANRGRGDGQRVAGLLRRRQRIPSARRNGVRLPRRPSSGYWPDSARME
jgi:hypothetical protein